MLVALISRRCYGFWNPCELGTKWRVLLPIAARHYGYDTNNGPNVATVWRDGSCPVLVLLLPGFYRQCSLGYDHGGQGSLAAEFLLMAVFFRAHWIVVRFLQHESRFAWKKKKHQPETERACRRPLGCGVRTPLSSAIISIRFHVNASCVHAGEFEQNHKGSSW